MNPVRSRASPTRRHAPIEGIVDNQLARPIFAFDDGVSAAFTAGNRIGSPLLGSAERSSSVQEIPPQVEIGGDLPPKVPEPLFVLAACCALVPWWLMKISTVPGSVPRSIRVRNLSRL